MSSHEGLVIGEDGQKRCSWCARSEEYRHYHDREWGRPVSDDRLLFEKISLEGFQTGLSWLTVLRKRPHFLSAFKNFDFNQIAQFRAHDIDRLVSDPGIIRHRAKIESVVNNARRACELVCEKGSLGVYFWSFEPSFLTRPQCFDWKTLQTISQSPASVALWRDMKRRGWVFVGPTLCYAFMQATGLVNDHTEGCHVREQVEEERAAFIRPCQRS